LARASTSFFSPTKERGWSAFADHDEKKKSAMQPFSHARFPQFRCPLILLADFLHSGLSQFIAM
jgi:hypothetical protein